MNETASKRRQAARSGEALYCADFYSWTEQQSKLLRTGRLDLIDGKNLAEEIDTLGRSEAAALRSSYRLIGMHLLKMVHQPERATPSWEHMIHREKLNVETILADNPGLKPKRPDLFAQAYGLARREAAFETGLDLNVFPEKPPFTLESVESSSFWPAGFPLKD